MDETTLPEGFDDLQPLVTDWAFVTEAERNTVRRGRSLQELESYYHQVLPRMEAVMEFLLGQPPVDHPADVARLVQLSLMFIEVASAVEFYRQPDLPDGFSADRFHVHL